MIYGEKKGGGGHTPVEADDTLASKQTLRLLFALSEGEIQGIDDILVNSASVTNYASTINYEVKTGTADQAVIKGFSEVEAPLSGAGSFPVALLSGVQHVYSLLGSYGATRVNLMIDRLMMVTGEGDRVGYEVSLSIYKRNQPFGGSPSSWQLAGTITKTGKCTNPYSWDVRVEKPDATTSVDTWGIMVVRDSADDADDKHYSDTFLSAITTITEAELTYPKTALVGVTITDAAQFSGSIPEIKFKTKGIKLPLPVNYNPVTRVYTGVWNGAFKSVNEYTNNLSWVIYWCLRNADWGLGISSADIDVGSFYTFAQYCDVLVSDGKGGTEPRFTINHQFIERDNVPTFLMYLSTLGNANFTANELGQIKIVWDGAGQAVTKIVTNANVLDGTFNYSSSDLENRTNLVNVTYMREELLGDSDTATFYDDSLITRYGLQTSDVVLLGCTSESQALRKARWTLWNNCYATQIISFKQSFNGSNYAIGDLVSIMDSDNVTTNAKHAVVANYAYTTLSTITLDRSIVLDNVAYQIQVVGADGHTLLTKTINQTNGTFSSITYAGSDAALVGANLIFTSTALQPRLAKVIKIDKDENSIYSIATIEHSESKYAYINDIGTITPPSSSGSFVNFDNYTIPAVTGIAVQEVFSTNGAIAFNKLQISWLWSAGVGNQSYAPKFELSYRRDSQDFVRVKDLMVATYDVEYPVPGVYEIFVWATNPFTNLKSVVASYTYNYRTAVASSTLRHPINVIVPNTAGVSFSGRNLVLQWDYNPLNDVVVDAIKDYVVEVLTTANVVKATYPVALGTNKGGSFTLSYDENVAIFGSATRSFNVRIYSRDLIGDLSDYIAVNPNNPAPVVTTFNVSGTFNAAYLQATIPTDTDLVSFTFKKYSAASGGSLLGTITTVSNYTDFEAATGVTYYYTVTPNDAYGAGTETTRSGATAVSADPDTFTYAGLTFKPNDPSSNSVSWTSFVATRNGTEAITVASGNATWSTGTLYLYYIPNNTTLQTSTSLVTAIASGGRILATYKGGTDLTADAGRAFTSGDMVLAGTVGASQLVTNTAIITNNAQVGNVLQSDNYSNSGTYAGWRLDKTGTLYANSISIKDSSGNIVMAAGGAINWLNVTGTNLPAANATVGAIIGTNLSGQITSGTASTYIANGAIQTAQIADANITNAKIDRASVNKLQVVTADIVDANVSTLKIQGNAITVPAYASGGTADLSMTYVLTGVATELYAVFVSTTLVQGYLSHIRFSIDGIEQWVEYPIAGTMMSRSMVYYGYPGTYTVRLWSDDPRNTNNTSISIIATKR